MKSFYIGITYVIVVLLIESGCAAAKPDSSHANTAELLVAIGSEPETGFDPTKGWGSYGSPLFQSTLLKRERCGHCAHRAAYAAEAN